MEETVMTATKAIAGGVAANIVTVVIWTISKVPGWTTVPEEPKAAILGLVSAGIGAAIVYLAPANAQTLTTTTSVKRGPLGASFRRNRAGQRFRPTVGLSESRSPVTS
jgi:hypothetical protein